ncbi:UNVERIFIED_ORG: hypothetical protein FNL38_10464 [Nocardia globerula]|uniref:Uncharacterized protein n=1 Tax=Nocardia globerula TaxID=1818 RepID=A0A652YNL0_NOCGL|nr:hypothetical protein C8E04_5904 [Rhodococcus globerulus]
MRDFPGLLLPSDLNPVVAESFSVMECFRVSAVFMVGD